MRKYSGAHPLDLLGRTAYPVLCYLVPEVAARNPQAAGGFRLRAVGRLQRSQDERFLDLGQEVTKVVNLGQDIRQWHRRSTWGASLRPRSIGT